MQPRTWHTKWTDESLADAVAKSRSIRQTLIALGLNASGANYRAVPIRVKELGLSVDHWTGRGWNRGKDYKPVPNPYRWELGEILIKNSPFKGGSYKLKHKLLKAGLLKNECQFCINQAAWQGRPLSLQLDHINGIYNDNRLENLRLLCPNCHSQTETFCRKKKSPAYTNSATSPQFFMETP